MALNLVSTFQEIAEDKQSIENIKDTVKNNLFYEDASQFFTVQPGIKNGQQVVALEPNEYVTQKDKGCSPTFDQFAVTGVSQEWDLRLASVRIKMCHTEFNGSFMRWALAKGYDVKNIGEAEFFDFINYTIVEAMKSDFLRLALFGDADVAGQSILQDANKAKYYDVIDKGLIPTLQSFKANDKFAGQFIDIAENQKATRAEQMALSTTTALDIFEKLTDEQYFESNQILTSNSLFKNYKNFLRRGSGNTPLESSKEQIQKGMESLMFDGEALTVSKFYDKKRVEDFTKAGKTHLPHFALNTSKDNLIIGIDDANALTDLRLEYVGGSDENFYIKANYQMDFKIPNPYAMRVAL